MHEEVLAELLDSAHRAGRVRTGLSPQDVHHLVCAVQFAVRLAVPHGATAADRYTEVLLTGLRP